MDDRLLAVLLDRAGHDEDLPPDARALVVAAFQGQDELDTALVGVSGAGPEPQLPEPRAQEPLGAYLRAITVAGFRGVGPERTLDLEPGPGLTLVTGRNGSGKSSFADALELVLTGDSARWRGRPQVWQEGWRNLHVPHPTAISVDLVVEGRDTPVRLGREWGPAADLWASSAYGGVTELGWSSPLATYRPFLSQDELGAMLTGAPSELYDALADILGLDELTAADKRLADARSAAETRLRAARARLAGLLRRLAAVDDPRARRCAAALSGASWDVEEVAAAALGGREQDLAGGGTDGRLRRLATLPVPDAATVAEVSAALRFAAGEVLAVAGTQAELNRRLGRLLAAALEHHEQHGDGDCPVCGRKGALNPRWHARAEGELASLTASAKAAETAHAALRAALRTARALGKPVPAELAMAEAESGAAPAAAAGTEPAALEAGAALPPALTPAVRKAVAAWRAWAAGGELSGPHELADHLDRHGPRLHKALAGLRRAVERWMAEREDRWRPVAQELVAWLPQADEAQRTARVLPAVRTAGAWLRDASNALRNERLAPLAARAEEVWAQLRQESNVELGPIRLEGVHTRRRVVLDVAVDGVRGAALGLMSQGELHALALSLFLPRATLPESPFRFLVIDDPVQAMDPAKVEGLAAVLARTAQDRQVLVFTHDDRLPEAVRRLQVPSTIMEISRREGSVLDVRRVDDRVDRYLDDARLLATTPELDGEIGGRLVPGFCRSAIEAACMSVVRRRRLGRGDRHDDVEQALRRATKTKALAALALFDDPRREREVVPRLRELYGPVSADCFEACTRGVHVLHPGDLPSLVRRTRRLARQLQS